MANPWDQDEVVGGNPWDADEVIAPAPKARPKGRDAQLAGRSIARGVAGTIDLIGQGARKLPGMALFDAAMGYLPGLRDAADAYLTQQGVAQPETSGERVASDVGEALTGNALTMGAGVLGNVRFLRANPVLQATGAATGAVSAGLARENGASPIVQMAAGLAGGLAPAGVRYAAPELVRRTVRGGEQGRKAMQQAIDDADAAGAPLSVGQASDNWLVQALESTLGRVPGSAGRMARFAENQNDAIGRTAQQTAEGLSPNPGRVNAGEAIIDGIRGPQGFEARKGNVLDALYGRLDRYISPQERVTVQNTRNALDVINPEIPGAPALTPFFQNAKLGGIKSAVGSDTEGAAAALSRPGVADWADDLRASLRSEADAIAERNQAARERVIAENARRRSVMLPDLPLPPGDPVPTPKQIEDHIAGRIAAQADGRLPYEAVKKTRTLVGREAASAPYGGDINPADWWNLYGGLSDDMKAAAWAAGPHASRAFARANKHAAAGARRTEAIAPILKAGAPERVYDAALRGGTRMEELFKSLPQQNRNAVAAAVISRLGKAKGGAQNADTDAFSNQTFLTNWSNLDEQARSTLLRYMPAAEKSRLQAMLRTTERIRNGSRVLANPSGTAAAATQGAGYGALGLSALTGNVPTTVGLLGIGAAANVGARAATSRNVLNFLTRKSTPKPAALIPLIYQRPDQD